MTFVKFSCYFPTRFIEFFPIFRANVPTQTPKSSYFDFLYAAGAARRRLRGRCRVLGEAKEAPSSPLGTNAMFLLTYIIGSAPQNSSLFDKFFRGQSCSYTSIFVLLFGIIYSAALKNEGGSRIFLEKTKKLPKIP